MVVVMEVSVHQAADAIGVTDRRVRQLITDGRIRARRVGSQWLVDGASLPSAPRRGRPLSPANAARLLVSSEPPRTHVSRWRTRRERLLDDPDRASLLASWAASRAKRMLFTTREPAGVLDDPAVVRSGISDSRSGISAADVAEAYVRAGDLEQVRRRHLLRPATGQANVILHVGDDLPPSPVPLLLLCADLAEHDGTRAQARANALILEALRS